MKNKIRNKHFYNESLPLRFFLRTMKLENRAGQDMPDLLLLTHTIEPIIASRALHFRKNSLKVNFIFPV
jgi:hypothetical protein